MKNLNQALLAATLLTLTACGGQKDKVDELAAGLAGGGSPSSTQPSVVNGPALDGHWQSDCIKNPLVFNGEGTRIIDVIVSGANITQTETSYVGQGCREKDRAQTVNGTFRFEKQQSNGAFTIEVKNGSALYEENVALANGVLSITGFAGYDDLKTLTPDVALLRLGDAPAPTPAPIPGKSADLDSGLFMAVSGHTDACAQSVSTMKQNGVVAQVYVDLQQPCSGSLTFTCDGGVCANDEGYSIQLKDSNSYDFTDTNAGWTAGFRKR